MRGVALSAVWAFVRLGRPQFLVGGFVSFALGAAISHASGRAVRWSAYGAGQAVVTSIQLMTHYANDYFDFEADVANGTPTRWSGGSRVLPGGEIPRSAALIAALAFAGCALVAMGIVHFALGAGGVVEAALMAMMIGLAWAYSAPPLRLHSRGVGELCAALVVAAFVPWLGFAVQSAELARTPVLAAVPLVCLQFAMLLAIEFPDRRGDAAVGKNTLVVRLGVSAARSLHHAALVAAYAVLPLLVFLGLPVSVALAVLCTAPLALVQRSLMARGRLDEPAHWERIAFCSVALVFSSTLAELIAFLRW
jgi:1,4-dihydroxy-2-naphthoate octaprenyltransferase